MDTDISQALANAEDELRSLQFEKNLVSQALSRKSRRSPDAPRSKRLTKEMVEAKIERGFVGVGFNSGHIARAFGQDGIQITSEGVRGHLRNIERDGRLRKDGKTYFWVSRANGNGAQLQASPQGGSLGEGELGTGPDHGHPATSRELVTASPQTV